MAPPNHTGGLDLCSFQVLEWKEWVICPQPERPLRLEFIFWVLLNRASQCHFSANKSVLGAYRSCDLGERLSDSIHSVSFSFVALGLVGAALREILTPRSS